MKRRGVGCERRRLRWLRTVAAAVAVLIAIQGCAAIEYKMDPERTAYLVGKDVAYGLLRFNAIRLEDAEGAVEFLRSLRVTLAAADEASFDEGLRELVSPAIGRLENAGDREVLNEIVSAALDDLELADPSILGDRRREAAGWVIGGILDGIAGARRSVAEPAA